MTVKQRLIEFLKYEKIGQKKFAQSIGMSDGYVNAIRVSIQPDTLHKIAMRFPELNTGWLLTGEGEMLKKQFLSDAKKIEIDNYMNIPLVPIRASAGYLKGYIDMEYLETLPSMPVVVDKSYKGKYMCFEVDGDSMDDGTRNAICNKDIVLGREVKRDLWRDKLHIRDWDFIIVHKTEGITIKSIIHHNVDTGVIKCHPTNPIYEDFEINLDDVLELYNVVKIVDRSTRR